MSGRLQSIVEASDGGCYAIEWALSEDGYIKYKSHYNPQWRIDGVQKKGLKGLYTTESAGYTFMPGEGLVGAVYAAQKPLFVADLQTLSPDDVKAAMSGDTVAYCRVALAKDYDLHSAVFVPVKDGVIEVGCTAVFESISDFLPDAVVQAIISNTDVPAMQTTSSRVDMPQGSASPKLEQLVEGGCGACYGIEWALSEAGCLKYKGHYNPQWRVEGVQKKGLKGLYTTASADYTYMPGEGLVGAVYAAQKALFAPDLQSMSQEDIRNAMFGENIAYQRADLAKQFDIHSAVFIPVENGVIEVGSTSHVACAADLLPESTLKAAGLVTCF